MELSLAFSPCPNDTFAFYAMLNGLVDTEGLTFRTELADVEELNRRASLGRSDICKLSYHAFFSLSDRYCMLRSGSALGFNNGPLLVKKESEKDLSSGAIFPERDTVIAVPGLHTTGALLLRTAYPECRNLKPMLFSRIEEAVLQGGAEAGVLIHEGRFTYRDKGLVLVRDLGTFWQDSFGMPIPLGGIAVNRQLEPETAAKINRVLKKSIRHAMDHPRASASFVMENAREISRDIQLRHIGLFVNEYTLDIGEEGEKAVAFLYGKFRQLNGLEKERDHSLFIPS